MTFPISFSQLYMYQLDSNFVVMVDGQSEQRFRFRQVIGYSESKSSDERSISHFFTIRQTK